MVFFILNTVGKENGLISQCDVVKNIYLDGTCTKPKLKDGKFLIL